MTTQVDTIRKPVIDRGIAATDDFTKSHYRLAALVICNRIRADLGLADADHLMRGEIGDSRYGNPLVRTIAAGDPLMVAYFDFDSIVVDTVDQTHVYPLNEESTVPEFVRRFDDGEYPKLNARNGD